MTEEEVMAAALGVARSILDGGTTPRAGAARIWVLSAENGRACSRELAPFIAAASSWDETPEYRDTLLQDIQRAAEELVAAHGG